MLVATNSPSLLMDDDDDDASCSWAGVMWVVLFLLSVISLPCLLRQSYLIILKSHPSCCSTSNQFNARTNLNRLFACFERRLESFEHLLVVVSRRVIMHHTSTSSGYSSSFTINQPSTHEHERTSLLQCSSPVSRRNTPSNASLPQRRRTPSGGQTPEPQLCCFFSES